MLRRMYRLFERLEQPDGLCLPADGGQLRGTAVVWAAGGADGVVLPVVEESIRRG